MGSLSQCIIKQERGVARDAFLKGQCGTWRGGIEHQEQGTPGKDTQIGKGYAQTVEMGREPSIQIC